MARYSGKGGLVYLGTAGGSKATTFATLSTWSIDMSTDKAEVTGFADTNKQYMQGLPDMVGAISGFWDNANDTLYDTSRAVGPVNMYLYPTSNALGKYWGGTAWVDFSIECPVDGPVTISGDWAGAGNWQQI